VGRSRQYPFRSSFCERWEGQEGRKEGTHNTSTVSRSRRNLLPLNDQKLTLNPLRPTLDIPSVRSDEVESPDAFSVETGVLGVGLADEEGDLAGDEVSDGPGVVVEVAGSEAL
jgi:hypothetical protein